MSVAAPQILFAMQQTSGTVCTNSGTVATNGAVNTTSTTSTENTNWSWNAGPPTYWRAITPDHGTGQAWIGATTITLPTTNTQSAWLAIGFRLASFATSNSKGYLIGTTNGDDQTGGLSVRAVSPTAGGNFDLQCWYQNGSGLGITQAFTGMVFGTDYRVIYGADTTSPGASVAKFKLDSASIVNGNGASFSVNGTTAFVNNMGYIGRGGGFNNYNGITGRIYYVAHWRGITLSDADLASVNTDPTTITGWPGAVTGGFLNRNYWWGNQ